MTVYTSGEWHVKAGREQEFERIWRGFGGLNLSETGAGPGALLLRDAQDHQHYRSFGHWPDQASVTAWQSSNGFARWMTDLRETVDRMESSVLGIVESVGANPEVMVGSVQHSRR